MGPIPRRRGGGGGGGKLCGTRWLRVLGPRIRFEVEWWAPPARREFRFEFEWDGAEEEEGGACGGLRQGPRE
jgi:hypothetical protein